MKPIAALIFFTRLPLWRWFTVPPEYYKNLVAYWSMSGWITASISAFTLWCCSHFLPFTVSLLLAILARLLLTGGLHEDGLADFFDGFGGGRSRERILAIMKDSHIGSYGVLALILYFFLYYSSLNSLSLQMATLTLLMADPASKLISSMIINRLPYARKEEESKAKVTYSPMTKKEMMISAFFGLTPLLLFGGWSALLALILPVILFFVLTNYMKKRINGYTGDCCGALFLLCEVAFIINYLVIIQWN